MVGYDVVQNVREEEHYVDRKSKRDSEQNFLPPTDKDTKFRWGLRGKTFWDWLQLLVVPLMLALITVVFTWQQNGRQNELEERRAEAERALAQKRAQDEALQAYLDQMSTLLLQRDLRSSTEDTATEDSKEARTLARARTLTVLERLDPSRKAAVMRFLVEAKLVQRVEEGQKEPIIKLGQVTPTLTPGEARGADLVGLEMSHADLLGADLIGVDLRNADLHGTDLSYTNLANTNLSSADLRSTRLRDANLDYANLRNAEGITAQSLEQQAISLKDATMPNGQKYEDWLESEGRGADGENSGPS